MPINGIPTRSDHASFQRALAYINHHYSDNLSLENIAIEVGLNKKVLQALMQAEKGLTVHHYLLQIRVDNAAEDLANFEKPVKIIAHTHGFSSQSHFGRIFKKKMGMTPRRYRMALLHTEKYASFTE